VVRHFFVRTRRGPFRALQLARSSPKTEFAYHRGVARSPVRPTLVTVLLAVAGCEAKEVPSAATSVVLASARPAPEPRRVRDPPICPEGMARVDAFCIDRYEAHLVEARAPERVLRPFDRPGPSIRAMARSRAGVVPQAYLDRHQAADACRAAGKRLCRAREWYRACAGARAARYPYGDAESPGRCNTGKGHVMQKVFGTVRFTFADHYNNPRLNQEPGFLATAGAYAACVSEDGVHDMVGNLHEWVEDSVSPELRRQVPLETSAHLLGPVGNGVFMGGYYSSRGEHGAGCAYATTNHRPEYHDYSIGFRCCAGAHGSPPPDLP
jgi:formylglycine-generating enzyme